MNSKKTILFIVIAFFSGVLLFRWSGVLKSFHVESTSNEPNLKHGSRFLGSSLRKPERLDFVYFKFSDSLDAGGMTIVKRLIAIPGDTLECKNGYYYINGNNIDEGIDLRFQYEMTTESFNANVLGKVDNPEAYPRYNSETIIVFLDYSFVKNLPVKLERYSSSIRGNLSKEVFSNHIDWTVNNFGPVVLPEEKYFFSGDNRDNSYDSRWRGFVDEDNISGTLILQF